MEKSATGENPLPGARWRDLKQRGRAISARGTATAFAVGEVGEA